MLDVCCKALCIHHTMRAHTYTQITHSFLTQQAMEDVREDQEVFRYTTNVVNRRQDDVLKTLRNVSAFCLFVHHLCVLPKTQSLTLLSVCNSNQLFEL